MCTDRPPHTIVIATLRIGSHFSGNTRKPQKLRINFAKLMFGPLVRALICNVPVKYRHTHHEPAGHGSDQTLLYQVPPYQVPPYQVPVCQVQHIR